MSSRNWIIGILFVCVSLVTTDEAIVPPTDTESSGGGPDSNCPDNNENNEFNPPQIHSNCTNHNVTYLVMGNVSKSLFIATNFSQAFCNNDEVQRLERSISVQNTKIPYKNKWPEVETKNGSVELRLTKWHTKRDLQIFILTGTGCSEVVNQTKGECEKQQVKGSCTMYCVKTDEVCENAIYNEATCTNSKDDSTYFVNVTSSTCTNCNNPVKKPEAEKDLTDEILDPTDKIPNPEEPLNSDIANKVMESFTSDFVKQFNESTVALTVGETITGVLVKQIDPNDLNEVSFGYTSNKDDFSILEERSAVSKFSRSVTVSKEAFEKALSLNNTEPFVAVFRFINMSKDEYNNSVLGDEVIAIEMGTMIQNLTDTINVNFLNMDYEGIPSCFSWRGNGSRPVWTSDGCETHTSGQNVTCRCTHMTFFAVLLTPLNETISVSDLNTLTTITRVGCGLSMFFLGIVLFMHFVMRRARSSNSTKILIHLVIAMFLLDFAFLVNDFVAKTKHVIGCKIMAATMHYFMLCTFTWFAVHAFHLCLQLYHGGKIVITRYVLKVSIVSWVIPTVIGITLLSVGKYGEVVINTGDAATNVAMCWILDNDVHYIVNIGYYALVFLFTFSTFILMLTWLCCVSRKQKLAAQGKSMSSCQRIVTLMGLCCILGVTWGCAFFAYGIFRLPAYYCFTILNSFQGFCLFIYYYKTSRMVESADPQSSSSSGSSSTLKTNLDEIFNPYDNCTTKPKPE